MISQITSKYILFTFIVIWYNLSNQRWTKHRCWKSLVEFSRWCIGHSMRMSKENRHAMLFLAKYILVIDLLTLSIWIIFKKPYTYDFIRSDGLKESAKSNVVYYIELHHIKSCHLQLLALHHIMVDEESLLVGIWNIAFCTETMWHSYVHFIRKWKPYMFIDTEIDQKSFYTFYAPFGYRIKYRIKYMIIC